MYFYHAMSSNKEQSQTDNSNEEFPSPIKDQVSCNETAVCNVTDKDTTCAVCRVCQSVESDGRGDAALRFLGIIPPLQDVSKGNEISDTEINLSPEEDVKKHFNANEDETDPAFVEFVSPDGEIYICRTDIEAGSCYQENILITLGCSCKSDLSLAHYSCALKWFISHGSSICEICGSKANHIRPQDLKKIMTALKEYESLTQKTASGEFTNVRMEVNTDVDPDALAAIRRQRLSEIAMWFNPTSSSTTWTTDYQVFSDQSSVIPPENVASSENSRTKWVLDGTAVLTAAGLLAITLAWLIAPRVGKKTAKNGLHILLGGLCALTVSIFLRFVVPSRMKYGPVRYWVILFVVWFLVFGIWASKIHGKHST